MKILLSAYACEPGIGSEPEVGWNLLQVLAEQHQVWILSSSCHRSGLETALRLNPPPNPVQVVYFDPLHWVYDWRQPGLHLLVHLHYALWQIQAYAVARRLHATVGFDLIHHGTYGTYLKPSWLALLPPPFIWGPVGGGESLPPGFWRQLSGRDRLYEGLRSLVRRLAESNPLVRLTVRRSQVIWASTPQTAARLRDLGAKSVRMRSSMLWPDSIELGISKTKPTNAVRFLSVGRLLHWKGIHLGLQAFAQAAVPGAQYWIVGEGPEGPRLRSLVKTLGLDDTQVRFLGKLTRAQVLDEIRAADVLVHASLHDSGGFVCLEAMAQGRPVICLDWGGPALQVTDTTGVKVPVTEPEETIARLAAALKTLGTEPSELRHLLGNRGISWVQQQFSPQQWVAFLGSLYEEQLHGD